MKLMILFVLTVLSGQLAMAQTSCDSADRNDTEFQTQFQWQTKTEDSSDGKKLSVGESRAYLATLVPYAKLYQRSICLPAESDLHREIGGLVSQAYVDRERRTDDDVLKDFDENQEKLRAKMLELRSWNNTARRQQQIEKDLSVFADAARGDKDVEMSCIRITKEGSLKGLIYCSAYRETLFRGENKRRVQSAEALFRLRPHTRFPIGILFFDAEDYTGEASCGCTE